MLKYYVERMRPDRIALIETDASFVEIDFWADHVHVYAKEDAVIRPRVHKRLNFYRLLGHQDSASVSRIKKRYQELLESMTIGELAPGMAG